MIRVLVAAASVVVRAGLEALLSTSSELTVVGSVSSLNALAQAVADLQPEVVLLELDPADELPVLLVPGPGGTEAALVLLADEPSGAWAAEALRAGVRAVLPPEASAAEIVAAVQAAAAGLVAIHPELVEALLSGSAAAARTLPAAATQTLTPREIEVLTMLAEGLGNKTIAKRLNISEHTVKFHVGSIFVKLNASSRTEAVTLGARQGLILL